MSNDVPGQGPVERMVGPGAEAQTLVDSDAYSQDVWECFCDMPKDGQRLLMMDVLKFGQACADKARASERERGAKIADDHDPSEDVSACDTAEQIAAKIRGA